MNSLNVNSFAKSLLASVMLIFAASTYAADKVYTGFLSSKAVSGYDTVSYFTEGKPVKGKKKYSTKYNGATWLFSSQENLDLFKAEPEKYAPQYGGYCAWAAAHDVLYKADATQWHIHEDKLYLNVDAKIKKQWLAQKVEKIKDADKNWPGLIN